VAAHLARGLAKVPRSILHGTDVALQAEAALGEELSEAFRIDGRKDASARNSALCSAVRLA
jgi:hypothetical protein